MDKNDRIYIAQHKDIIGSAILRRLASDGFKNLITRDSSGLDLTDQKMVFDFFTEDKPEYVFLTTAKAGGIVATTRYPGEFAYTNLQAECNVIHSAWRSGVRKLLFLGSSCIYPRDCPQPMREEYLLSGRLEPTTEAYAIAKIAGIKICQAYNFQYATNFICAVPGDNYGPNDDFNLETAHVLPALLRKMHEAKIHKEEKVTVWGTGSPRRECLHVDDLADACVFLMNHYDSSEIINIGCAEEISIGEVAFLIREIVGFNGDIVFDESRPDGAPRKLVDISKMSKLGWKAKIDFRKGIEQTYQWYRESVGMVN